MRFALKMAAIAALAAAPATAAMAEGLSLARGGKPGSRLDQFRAQTRVLDSRAAKQYDASFRLTPRGKAGATAAAVAIPTYTGRYRGLYLEAAKSAARKHGVPEDLFLRLVQQESGWNPGAVSNKGATGLAQLMPETARRLGVDATDPQDNLDGGARYLRMMYDRFGDWRLALAAYNAGPLAVDKSGGVPPYEETQGYVLAILGG